MALLTELDQFFSPNQTSVISNVRKRGSKGKLIPLDENGYALLKDLPQGEFFRRKKDSKVVYTREHYNRDIKKYTCVNYENIGKEIYLKSNTKVIIGFTY